MAFRRSRGMPVETAMNITLKQIRVFCAVYELRSFTAASRVTHVTQSAVSKLCAELEAEVGQPLFERSTRSVVPCEGAADFYAYAQEILGTVRAAERSLGSLRSLQRGIVGIASSPMMMYGLLTDVIAGYRRDHPGVQLDLYEGTTDDTVEHVRHGRADFGIVSTGTPADGLSARVVYRDAMFAVCPPGHALARRRSTRWADLAAHEHVVLRNVYSVRRALDGIRDELGLAFRSGIEANMLTSVLGMVRAGLGITVIPGYVCGLARQLGLRVVPIADAHPHRHELWLIHRNAARPTLAATVFIDKLERHLREREAEEAGAPPAAIDPIPE